MYASTPDIRVIGRCKNKSGYLIFIASFFSKSANGFLLTDSFSSVIKETGDSTNAASNSLEEKIISSDAMT